MGRVHWAQRGLRGAFSQSCLPPGEMPKPVGLISAGGEGKAWLFVHWAGLIQGVGYWQKSQILTAGLSYLC